MDKPSTLLVRTRSDVSNVARRIQDALELDDKDGFVSLVNSLTIHEDADVARLLSVAKSAIFHFDPRDCAAAILSGETVELFNADSLFSAKGHSFLHTAARYWNARITALLLEKGHVPDRRSDVDMYPVILKDALPLNVSLETIRCNYWESKLHGRKSVLRLITSLFTGFESHHIRTLRLLANKTKEIKHEFIEYLKQGKVVEVAALLMVANDRILSQDDDGIVGFKNITEMHRFLLDQALSLSINPISCPQSQRETQLFEMKETLQVLEIFNSIGDKLVAYTRLVDKPTSDLTLGVVSLLQDAGFYVDIEDGYKSSTLSYGWTPFQVLMARPFDEHSAKASKMELVPSWWKEEGLCYVPEKSAGCRSHVYTRRLLPREALLGRAYSTSTAPSVDLQQNLEQEVEKFILADNKEEFVSFLRSHSEILGKENGIVIPSKLLKLICLHRAVGCATALLEEQTNGRLHLDLNVALEGGLLPLQLASQSLSSSLTSSLLQHGAQVNVSDNHASTDPAMLPLSMALAAICRDQILSDWTPEKSIYKLIYMFCLKETKEALETIRLLAEKTEDIEKVALHCVEEGEVIQFAALLLVAWDRLMPERAEESPIGRHIWGQIGIIDNQESRIMMTCGLKCDGLECLKRKKINLVMEWKVLRVLEITRGVIEELRHRLSVEEVPNHEVPFKVACELCKEAGMVLTPDDVYSDDIACLRPKLKPEEKARLNEVINKQLQSITLPKFQAGDEALLNEIQEKKRDLESKLSTMNWRKKPGCCSVFPFMGSSVRAYHTSRGFDLGKPVRSPLSSDVHQVAIPSISMILPSARICARLLSTTKRVLK